MFQIFTATELADILECSEVTARKKARKKGYESTSRVVNGKPVEVFKVPDNEINELKQETRINKIKYTKELQVLPEDSDNIIEMFSDENKTFSNYNSQAIEPDSIKLFIEKISELEAKAFGYAEEAGKVKLLTDNSKFYQDEYFRLKYDNESILKKVDELTKLNNDLESANKNHQLKLGELQAELEIERNKKFFGIFKK